jgi:hypothetical protein
MIPRIPQQMVLRTRSGCWRCLSVIRQAVEDGNRNWFFSSRSRDIFHFWCQVANVQPGWVQKRIGTGGRAGSLPWAFVAGPCLVAGYLPWRPKAANQSRQRSRSANGGAAGAGAATGSEGDSQISRQLRVSSGGGTGKCPGTHVLSARESQRPGLQAGWEQNEAPRCVLSTEWRPRVAERQGDGGGLITRSVRCEPGL